MLRVLLFVITYLVAGAAFAADWTVDRLRGDALIQANGLWIALKVGTPIPNGVQVKTGSDGRLDLVRGAEKVTLGAGTQIQIRDAGSEMMTSIIQTSGELVADVERRNVQHFSVQTPFLAAVVKGTKFVVTVGRNGTTVDVERGVVQVQDTDHGLIADIQRGQQATVTTQSALEVQGGSNVQLYTTEGVPVSEDTAPFNNGNGGQNGNGNGNGGNNGNGNGNSANNGNGKGNSGNNGNGNGNSGNNGSGNGNSGNNGNGNGNSGNNGNGNGNSGNNGNGNGNSGNNGNGNGNGGNNGNGNGNGGNNGNGNGNGGNKDDD